jgi:hypothetical protein
MSVIYPSGQRGLKGGRGLVTGEAGEVWWMDLKHNPGGSQS